MKLRLQVAMLLLGIIPFAPSLFAQAWHSVSNPPSRPGSAEGQLTVTFTVVTSVGVVMDDKGKPTIVIANAPDPADNVSALRLMPQTEPKKPKTKK